jgi:hypothetical protein
MKHIVDSHLVRFAHECGCQVDDPAFTREWQRLQQAGGYDGRDLRDRDARRDLVPMIKHALGHHHESRRRNQRQAAGWIQRAYRDSDTAAVQAARDPEVKAFRIEHLSEGLLSANAVPVWIKARQGEYLGTLASLLEFPDGDSVGRVPTGGSPVLAPLLTITQRLEAEHGWRLYAATMFVLTGAVPLMWPITKEEIYTPRDGTQVQLTIESWVPAAVVQKVYRSAVQRTLYKAAQRGQRKPERVRGLSARQTALIAFLDRVDPTFGAADRLMAWNTAHRGWRYTDASNFRRDCRRALRRAGRDSAHRL